MTPPRHTRHSCLAPPAAPTCKNLKIVAGRTAPVTAVRSWRKRRHAGREAWPHPGALHQ